MDCNLESQSLPQLCDLLRVTTDSIIDKVGVRPERQTAIDLEGIDESEIPQMYELLHMSLETLLDRHYNKA